MKRYGRIVAATFAVAALGLAACTPPPAPTESAEPASSTAGETASPEAAASLRAPVTFRATEYQYDGPAVIPAGLTEIELVNAGEQPHGLMLVRIGEGKTIADIAELATAEGPLPDWISFPGGIGGLPAGQRASAVLDLTPGNYAVTSFETSAGDDTMDAARGMLQPLTVTEADGTNAALPDADVTIDMKDFAFALSGDIGAGTQTLKVVNGGQQAHEAIVMRLNEGVTAADVMKMLAAGPPGGEGAPEDSGTPAAEGSPASEGTPAEAGAPEEAGPPPFSSAGGLSPIDMGGTGFVTQSFTPGEYLFICFLPDTTTGTPHFATGMVQEFTVE